MSKETMQWLNNNTLIGNTDQRGHAWHYRASDQGAEPNHYAGFVPTDDVLRRLFCFDAVELPVYVRIPADFDTMSGIDDNGMPYREVQVPNRKAVAASDTGDVFQMFSGGYEIHQFRRWLLDNVAAIIGGDLGISSAGMLDGRAIAWVEVSVPETITTPEGVAFRPNLVACTSHNGRLATTYKRTITATVCDNTLSAALAEDGQTVKVRHSKYSAARIPDVRTALGMVHTMADDFTASVSRNVAWKISGLQFRTVLNTLIPVTDDMGKGARTIAETKRGEITKLYKADARCAPWAGTAFGVMQAFNTYEHHVARVNKGTDRAERNMISALNGDRDKADAEVMRVLLGV